MNSPLLCHPDQPIAFLRETMPQQQRAAFEAHLDECEVCREALDRAAASPEDWSQLRMSLNELRRDALGTGASRLPATDMPDLESCRKLLGPTDDPQMMGRIGSYEIVGILGRGGMGIVFKGFDAPLNRYVAIKMLAPVFSASGSSRQRFLREAQSAAAVVHEHVVAIHGISQWQDTPYLVMDYVRGESLQKRLGTRGYLPIRELLRIGLQVASGVAAAHAQGLIHRDIKPANILLESDVDRVRITDFGLARAVDDVRLTRTDMLLGTPQYMSPEQACDQPLDFRTDLYSLGVVLYEAAAGRPPFQAATSYGILRKIVEHRATPLVQLNPDIPPWFERTVMRLMEKDPQARFQTAGEVASLLTQCLAHVEQPQLVRLPPSLVEPTGRRSELFTKRRITMSTVALIALLGGSWLMFNGPAAPEGKGEKASAVESQPAVTVRGVADLTGMKMETSFDLGRLQVQAQAQEQGFGGQGGNPGGGGFAGLAASGGGGGSFLKPNLGIAISVERPAAKDGLIVELSRSAAATDDQGRTLKAIDPAPTRIHFPEFEAKSTGAEVLYFHETPRDAKAFARLEGEVLVTPGRVLTATFEGPESAGTSQRVGGETFLLRGLQQTGQGIEIIVVCPQIKALAAATNPQERMEAIVASRGAYSAELVDSTGEVHRSRQRSSGGFASSFGQGRQQANEGTSQTFGFATLPQGRQIKAIRVRMTERTGPTKAQPYKLENIAIR